MHMNEDNTTSLWTELSEQEQQQIYGGFSSGGNGLYFFYYDQLNIDTSAANNTSIISSGNGIPMMNGDLSANTSYRLSRTTFAFGGFLGMMNSDGNATWGTMLSPYQSIISLIAGFLNIIGR